MILYNIFLDSFMRAKEATQYSTPATPDNTFGLGIQVYKIESMLPRINSSKNDRRQMIKHLENPAFTRKQDRHNKSINASNDRIETRDYKDQRDSIRQNNTDVRKRSIINTRSSTINKLILKEKQRPPSAKVSLKTAKKEKTPTPKPVKSMIEAALVPQQRLVVTKNYPLFEHQQLKKLDDKISEISSKRKEVRRTLRKQLKSTRDESEQEKILKRLQQLESMNVVSEIVNSQELSPYDLEDEYQQFGLSEYLLRQKGEYQIQTQEDQPSEPVYRPMVYVSEREEQHQGDVAEDILIHNIDPATQNNQ